MQMYGKTGIFISFDDPRSVKEKVQYANKHNLKGVMAWHVGHDNGQLLEVTTKNLGKNKESIVYIFNAYTKNKFTVQDLRQALQKKMRITTVIFSFLHPHGNGKVTIDTAENLQLIKELKALKKEYPQLKLLMSLGGWVLKEGFFQADKNGKLKTVAYNAIKTVNHYGFDGLDIDWEYESSQLEQFKKRFALFVLYVKQALEESRKKLVLTVALPQNAAFYQELKNLKKISQWVNWINIMSYNYEGPNWSEITAHNAPLYSHKNLLHRTWKKEHHFESVDSTVQIILKKGVSPTKLVLGIPFYGRAFKGVKDKDIGLYQPHAGGIKLFGGFSDAVAYRDIAQFVGQKDKDGWTYYWDNECKVPYLFNPTGVV